MTCTCGRTQAYDSTATRPASVAVRIHTTGVPAVSGSQCASSTPAGLREARIGSMAASAARRSWSSVTSPRRAGYVPQKVW
jgi:hypothetical protein